MSGDVQPRKRKDKKKKKDDLGVEEPRGTAAALGEGDVFMHSYHEHGTGGHWCAKIIFFSLLAVLVTLIGLIILENRGLTELEANSVESRYSGVLEGWIEDAIDDHHDEHTLELKHHEDDEDHLDDHIDGNEVEEESLEEEVEHDDEDDSNEEEIDQSDEMNDDDEEDESENDDDENDGTPIDDEDESQDNNEDEDEDESQNENDDQDEDSDEEDDVEKSEESLKYADKEDDEEETYERYNYEELRESNIDEDDDDDDDNDDDEEGTVKEQKQDYLSREMTSHYNYQGNQEDEGDDYGDESKEENKYDDENEHNNEDEANEDDDEDDDDGDDEQEIEKIEKEIVDDSAEVRAASNEEEESKEDIDEDDSDDDEPPVEQISRPAGKPFVEIEEETPVKPTDTLAEEEEYERKQEELRRQEEEQTSHSVWLKLCVGGALLAATHAVVRRANAQHDTPETEEIGEETPSLIDRRMTIVEEPAEVTRISPLSPPRQVIDEEVFKRPAPVAQSAPTWKPKIQEEIVKDVVEKVLETPKSDAKTEVEKELYSEDEENEDAEEDEDVEEDRERPKNEPAEKDEDESEPEPEEVSDVEIIYDETIEEEEEEVEEEEISDVDDTELLNRLEAKYGRLPEPERPGQQKGGARSIGTEWPGEPSDLYWRSQLDAAEDELRQFVLTCEGAWDACATRVSAPELEASGRARWLRARALDLGAEAARDNRLLAKAITAYLHLLKMNERLSDRKLLEVARRTLDRIQFRGIYLNAEPVYRLLIRRFPDDVNYRNNLTVSFLMANRADLADQVLRETLRVWPNDRVALAHHGFVLKTHYNKIEEAVHSLQKALEGDAGQANEPRFYYHLGDALLLLGRFDEAQKIHKRGAELGHFLSPSQRSLYNVPGLRSRPWWRVEDTPYVELARALEASWREILKEGEAATALYEKEKEGLKERGEWSQLDVFVRGREVPGRCARAPATCAAVRAHRAAAACTRGQVKFSKMAAGTHVRAHVGPTNCRLRMHLGLSNTENTYIRVDKEIRKWELGKTLIFDDSFEHEVWHNGTGARLVLIVDVWHPDLTPAQTRQLPAI